MELYKKYRPTVLSQVIGCESTVQSLEAMVEAGNLPHAILLHGPSGCGKTTIARILKDMLECHPLDFQELNSALYRGIDGMRDIQSTMRNNPIGGPVRVWIWDEAHMLTKDAQNVALKILEDGPPHSYFFICTTDPDKLIAAFKSRPTPMPVRMLTEDELELVVDRVCKKEKISITPAIKRDLASFAGGNGRDVLVLLEKIASLPAAKQAAALEEKAAELNAAIDICRALIKKEKWSYVANSSRNLKAEPEEVRWAVLGYARTVLLKEGSSRAYIVIDCFRNNFYDSKQAGLAYACFEAIHAK